MEKNKDKKEAQGKITEEGKGGKKEDRWKYTDNEGWCRRRRKKNTRGGKTMGRKKIGRGRGRLMFGKKKNRKRSRKEKDNRWDRWK